MRRCYKEPLKGLVSGPFAASDQHSSAPEWVSVENSMDQTDLVMGTQFDCSPVKSYIGTAESF